MKKLLLIFLIVLCSSLSAQTKPSYLQLKDTQTIDIRTYGAIPDDGVCDAPYIQAALDVAKNSTGPAVVVVPKGIWTLSEPLDLGWVGGGVPISLKGEGQPFFSSGLARYNATLEITGAGGIIASGAETHNHLLIEDLAFVASGSGDAIILDRLYTYQINRCVFMTLNSGVKLIGSGTLSPINGEITNCTFYDNTVGIQSTGNQPNATTIRKNLFLTNEADIVYTGQDVISLIIDDNIMEYGQATASIILDGGNIIQITNNYMELATASAAVLGTTYRASGVTFSNNFIGGSGLATSLVTVGAGGCVGLTAQNNIAGGAGVLVGDPLVLLSQYRIEAPKGSTTRAALLKHTTTSQSDVVSDMSGGRVVDTANYLAFGSGEMLAFDSKSFYVNLATTTKTQIATLTLPVLGVNGGAELELLFSGVETAAGSVNMKAIYTIDKAADNTTTVASTSMTSWGNRDRLAFIEVEKSADNNVGIYLTAASGTVAVPLDLFVSAEARGRLIGFK